MLDFSTRSVMLTGDWVGSDICCNPRINSACKFVPHVHFVLVDSVLSSVAFDLGAAPAHSNYESRSSINLQVTNQTSAPKMRHFEEEDL